MKIVYSPALHFVILGALIFTAVLFSQGVFSVPERDRIFIPRSSIDLALSQFEANLKRLPSEEEYKNIVDKIIEEEVLYRYAIDLGIHKQPVVEERLAKISRFVEENPHEPKSKSERAIEAIELGLHEGDLVVRRILIDGSKRLIKAAVLMRVPSDDMLQAYLNENQEDFMLSEKTRITQITINELKYGENLEKRANEILELIKVKNLSPEDAINLEEPVFVEPKLPALGKKELQSRFGRSFPEELKKAPVGEWYGPIPSRYGMNLVYVHERIPPQVPDLNNIKTQVQGQLLNKLANEWLELRLEQLKEQYEIVIEGEAKS